MKVKTWVEFEQEVDVEVSIASVMGSIEELGRADELPMLFDCINCVHRVLRGITGEQIGAMTDKQREVIESALKGQAARYSQGASGNVEEHSV